MAERKIQPPTIETHRANLEQYLNQLGSGNLNLNLLNNQQEPIQAKAYLFTDINLSYNSDQGLTYLLLKTQGGLEAKVPFSIKDENKFSYLGLQLLNRQKNPPVWEAPTSPVAEFKILEATNMVLKQLQGQSL